MSQNKPNLIRKWSRGAWGPKLTKLSQIWQEKCQGELGMFPKVLYFAKVLEDQLQLIECHENAANKTYVFVRGFLAKVRKNMFLSCWQLRSNKINQTFWLEFSRRV